MKTCPKCRGKYFDTDTQCSDCRIELVDNKEYNNALHELESMTDSEREKHKFEAKYRIAYKYNFSY